MDSPETTKVTISTASSSLDSPPVQDSPFFNYISNLSPIKPVKSRHVAQELSGLSSPPIVFKSPRTIQHNETNVLKRSRYLQLSITESSQNIDKGKTCINGLVDSGQSVTLCQRGLTDEKQEDCDGKEVFETNPLSSSGCIDEFLADPGEADCVNSAFLATPSSKQSSDAPESSKIGLDSSKEIVLKFADKNGVGTDSGTKLEVLSASSEQAKKDSQGDPKFDSKAIEIEEEKMDSDWLSYECTNSKIGLHVGHAFKKKDCQNSHVQGIECGHQNDCEYIPQSSNENLQIVPTYKDGSEDVGPVFDGLVENIILNGHKASENQRGILRRCLQFEEALPCTVGDSDGSLNPASTVNSVKTPTSATELETFESCHVDSKATSSEKQMVNASTATLLHPRHCENFSTVSKPLGIGLHLNSIVNATGFTATASKKSVDHYLDMQEMKSGMMNYNLLENQSCSMSLSTVEQVSACDGERIDETEALILASSAAGDLLHSVQDQNAASDENSQNAYNLEEHGQLSPRKKRKKTASGVGSDGYKRCNCKKTKCLKLYCDCFAAGIYCGDSCACQGCFNRPENEKTVLETREQIESRNPLAFAPKIVQRVPEVPPNNGEDGNQLTTPSSARHKRGCNCKKSMCLKKYCECYQVNVGCSSGCRCEGCKNVYGRKEEYVAAEHGMTREMVSNRACKEISEDTFDKEVKMAETKRDLLCAESVNPHNLTPLTPSFQYSDHGKDAPKSRFLSKRHLPSPDSDLSILSSCEKSTKSPPRDLEKGDIILETSEDILNEGSHDWQGDYDTGTVQGSSSTHAAVPNEHQLTQRSDTPPMAMISSTSFRRRDSRNVPKNQLCPGSDRNHWHGSPLTPVTRSSGTKSRQELGSGSGSELNDIFKDETPVKISSPNKKRVSPPHSSHIHIHKLGSGSSGGLRSGRKFILKSVPSFPPLTPCIDSKSSTTQKNTHTLQLQDKVSSNQN